MMAVNREMSDSVKTWREVRLATMAEPVSQILVGGFGGRRIAQRPSKAALIYRVAVLTINS